MNNELVESLREEIQELKGSKTPQLRDLREVTKENDLTKAEAEMLYQALGVTGMSKAELRLFQHKARTAQLDPLTSQIYVVPFNTKVGNSWVTKYQAVTSIDGLRLIAQRSNKYQGQTQPEFYSKEAGAWTDVWISSDVEPNPYACRVGVLHADFKEPLFGLAHWSEYVKETKTGEVTKFWKEKPSIMIAKCAEALALRKAFPNDTSGLYTEEEVDRSIVQVEQVEEISKPDLVVEYVDGEVVTGEVLGDDSRIELVLDNEIEGEENGN